MTDTSTVWIVPPEHQGQIVEVAYSLHPDEDGWLYERVYDRSDRDLRFSRIHIDDLNCEWEPQNYPPNCAFEPCSAPGVGD